MFSSFPYKTCTNNTCKCYTEVFVPVASLNGMVGLPYLIIRSLIGSTKNVWSYAYTNAKWIYTSETFACTISDCAIVRKLLHVILTCISISWCSVDDNFKWTPRIWYSSFNFVEVNFVPESDETFSKSHQPNS